MEGASTAAHGTEASRNSLSVRGPESGQLRRLSPIPPSHQFATVPEVEETSTPGEEEEVFLPDTRELRQLQPREGGGGRKHRRRLPFISPSAALTKQRSSRSFDSGISTLLSDSGSPSPPLTGEETKPECEAGTPLRGPASLLSTGSPTHSPCPPKSPNTPSKRASFHAINRTAPVRLPATPAPKQLPSTPNPPPSPSYKVQSGSKPGFFSARRLSEQTSHAAEPGRTISPISGPQSPGLTKSPSPVYSSSSKSSPQLRGSPVLRPSYSLHSNESSSSPPPNEQSPDTCSPLSPAASPPVSRVSRRILPETPCTQPKEPCQGSPRSPAPKELPKPRLANGLANGVRKIAWQLVASHDSLDSGVYSRSNTSDSVRDPGPCFGRAASSPAPPSSTGSPILARHHSWRKSMGARLPELPTLPQDQGRRQSLPGAQQGETRLHSDTGVEALNLTPKRTYEGLGREQLRESEDRRRKEEGRRRDDCDGVASTLEAGLQVPNLRELKSHSFPPPWCEDVDPEPASCQPQPSHCHAPLNCQEPADERRRRWIYCRGYLSESRCLSFLPPSSAFFFGLIKL